MDSWKQQLQKIKDVNKAKELRPAQRFINSVQSTKCSRKKVDKAEVTSLTTVSKLTYKEKDDKVEDVQVETQTSHKGTFHILPSKDGHWCNTLSTWVYQCPKIKQVIFKTDGRGRECGRMFSYSHKNFNLKICCSGTKGFISFRGWWESLTGQRQSQYLGGYKVSQKREKAEQEAKDWKEMSRKELMEEVEYFEFYIPNMDKMAKKVLLGKLKQNYNLKEIGGLDPVTQYLDDWGIIRPKNQLKQIEDLY